MMMMMMMMMMSHLLYNEVSCSSYTVALGELLLIVTLKLACVMPQHLMTPAAALQQLQSGQDR